jgi:hypothetical protein
VAALQGSLWRAGPVTPGDAAGRGLSRSSPPSITAMRPSVGISQYLHDSRGRGRCVEVLIAVSFVCLFVP